MCNCHKNRNQLENIINLAIKHKKITGETIAIYRLFGGYSFCEVDFAKKMNYQIIEII